MKTVFENASIRIEVNGEEKVVLVHNISKEGRGQLVYIEVSDSRLTIVAPGVVCVN